MNAYLTFPACHRRGGVERILVECANFLAGRGHDVSVLSGEFDPAVLVPAVHQCQVPVRFKRPLLRLNSFRNASTTLLASLRRGKPSVHASFGVVCPPDGVLWVQSVHAEWLKIAQSSRSFTGRLKQRLNPFHPFILRLERRYYRGKLYRKLIALTPRVRDELIEHYDVPRSDIVLLPNGYNHEEFNPARRTNEREIVRGELKYAADDKVLVFVANELERKGFFPLIEALASLRNPQVKLLVVGRVSLDPHRDLIGKLGLSQQVRAIGPSADVGRYYAAAEVFVLPTYYEAWGLVIVEALASGIPVLTSRLAGAAVAVSDQTGQLLDDPKDPKEITAKLDALLTASHPSPETISQSVERFRWSQLLVTYESVLAQCVKG